MEAMFARQTLIALLTLNGLILCPVPMFASIAPPLAIPNVLLAAQAGSALLAVPTIILMITMFARLALAQSISTQLLILILAKHAPPLVIQIVLLAAQKLTS